MTQQTPDHQRDVVERLGTLAIVAALIVGVLLALPASQNPATVLAIVFGFLGNAVLSRKANGKLDRVLNGEMDRKIEDAVHRVLDQRDQERRDRGRPDRRHPEEGTDQ